MQTRGADNLKAGEDAALVDRMAGGDVTALRKFYDAHSAIVYALCLRILGDAHEAEEVLVDIFYEFWRRANSFDAGRGSPMGLLMSLTRSRAIDRRRSRDKLPTIPIEDPNSFNVSVNSGVRSGSRPDVAADERERRLSIRSALLALAPQQRQAIECAYYDGMSHSEIATAMDKPLGTVKTYIRQGLTKLKDTLSGVKQDMA